MSQHVSSDSSTSFEWDEYLMKTGGRPADAKCFKQSIDPPPNLFEVNTILEAEDQRSAALDIQIAPTYSSTPDANKSRLSTGPSSVGSGVVGSTRRSSVLTNPTAGTLRRFRAAPFTLAQVVEIWGPRLRIRLTGTDDRNDCWFLVDSDQIRPYPSDDPPQPPFGYMYNHLNWRRTVKSALEGSTLADLTWFIKPPPDPVDNFFQVGERFEAVDRRNTQLICPASVGGVNGHHILVSFDGWSGAFDYWTRFDSRELFPVGWCKRANYPLQSPGPNALRSPSSQSTPAALPPPPPLMSSGRGLSQNHNSVLPLPGMNDAVRTPDFSGKPTRGRQQSVPSNRRRGAYITPTRASAAAAAASSSRKSVTRRRQPFTKSTRTRRARGRSRLLTNARSRKSFPSLHQSWPHAVESDDVGGGGGGGAVDPSPPRIDLSANSSMRSMSSPPIIHPIHEEDATSDSMLNTSASSMSISDRPPCIVEDVTTAPQQQQSLTDDTPESRARRASRESTGSGSECVLRLQAAATADRLNGSDRKSWQIVMNAAAAPAAVVSAPTSVTSSKTSRSSEAGKPPRQPPSRPHQQRRHRTQHKRHRHSVDRTPNRLRKKFKLISEHPHRLAVISPARPAPKLDSTTTTTSRQDVNTFHRQSNTSSSLPAAPPQSSHSSRSPLHLYCDDVMQSTRDHSHQPVGDRPDSDHQKQQQQRIHRKDPAHDMNLFNTPFVCGTNGGGGGLSTYRRTPGSAANTAPIGTPDISPSGTSSTGYWYPGINAQDHMHTTTVLDTYSSNSTNATTATAITTSTDDGLDGQSLAPHISSSTVSPSSLDLGPGPLPNPAHWSIDDVCHYLTTRDSSLSEVALKFRHHEIDGQALLLLNMESLRSYLKVKLGPALKVDHLITRLKRGFL